MNRLTAMPLGEFQRHGFVKHLAGLIEDGDLTPVMVEGYRQVWGVDPSEVKECKAAAVLEVKRRRYQEMVSAHAA